MRRRPPVFVVDDDPAALSSVGALLASFDYDVHVFGSAEEFLVADIDLKLGCLLSDVRLPGMSGLELQSTLRSEGLELSVILISGYADSDMVREALENGAIAVVEKPIDPIALVELVETAVQVYRQA